MTQPSALATQPSRGSFIAALGALMTGIVAVSFAAIFIRLSEQEIGPFATIAHRFWIATLALGIWKAGGWLRGVHQETEVRQSLNRSDILLILLGGSIAAIDLSLWALSLSQTSVANAAVLGNLAPLFTALGSWILWRQGFSWQYWLGLAIALAGAVTIGLSDLGLGHWQGDAIAIFSAVLFSAYLLTLEQLRERLSATTVILSCSGVASVVSTAIALVAEDQFFPISRQGWLAVLGVALLSQTIGQGLVTFSLDRISSGLVAMTFLLEPVIAALIAWVLFSETLDWVNAIGFGLVIFGIYQAISSEAVENSH